MSQFHSDSPQPTTSNSPKFSSSSNRQITSNAENSRNAVEIKHRRTRADLLFMAKSEGASGSPVPPLRRQPNFSKTSQSYTRTIISPTSEASGYTCHQSAGQITTSDIHLQGATIHAPMPKRSHISKLLGWSMYNTSQTRSSSPNTRSQSVNKDVSSNISTPRDNLHRPGNLLPIVRSATAPSQNGIEDDKQIHASFRTDSNSTASRASGLRPSTHELSDANKEIFSPVTLGGTHDVLSSMLTGSGNGSRAETAPRTSVSTVRGAEKNGAGYPAMTSPSASLSASLSGSKYRAPSSSPSPSTTASSIPVSPPHHSMPDGPSLTRSSSSSTVHFDGQRTPTLPSSNLQSGSVLERKTKFSYSPVKLKKRDSTTTLAQTVQNLETQCEKYALEINSLKSELETSEKQRKNATEISRFLMSEWGPIAPEQDEMMVANDDGSTGATPSVDTTICNLQGQVVHLTAALQLITKVAFGEEFDILPDQIVHPASPEDRDAGITTRWDQLSRLIRRKSATRSAATSLATAGPRRSPQDGPPSC